MFDDVKHEIDGIGFTNEITYNGVCNVDDAELTDKLTDKGWFVTSTVPTAWAKIKEGTDCVDTTLPTGDVTLSDDTIDDNKVKWFSTCDYTQLKESDVDINFMKRLLLSASEIWRSKGTLESIDMVMGLFGFGENDYEITEEYYTVCPIKATDTLSLATRTEENNTRYSRDGESAEEKTYEEYVNEILDNIGNVYDVPYSGNNVNYDLYPGIPLGKIVRENSTTHENEEYFVPMIEQGKWYDGDVYFQSKGGWGRHKVEKKNDEDACVKTNETLYEYIETLSYLRTAYDIEEMLSADYSSVKEGDYFYVENIADYYDYDENPSSAGTNPPCRDDKCKEVSHFFKLVDEYQHDRFKGWKNINCQNYTNDDEGKKEYEQDLANIEHLINIISISDGNNPHVGYGDYDKGKIWSQYMKLPFKYAIDNYLITDAELEQAANKISFTLTRRPFKNTKVNDTEAAYVFYEDDGTIHGPDDNNVKVKNYFGKNIVPRRDECSADDKYILNSKIVTFKFNVKQESDKVLQCKEEPTIEDGTIDFKEYFFNKIAPFLMQVIPSTTILAFEFNEDDGRKGEEVPADDFNSTSFEITDDNW